MGAHDSEGCPPDTIPAGRLFRILAQPKRAVWPLAFRLPFAADIPLSVRALSGAEYAAAHDADGIERQLVASTNAANLIAATLCTPGGLAFHGPDPVYQLTESELVALAAAVSDALAVVSPVYGVCDSSAWGARLRDGVMLGGNAATAIRMSEAVDVSVGWGGLHRQQRPDRYYGRALHRLTDGQLMAYRAACAVVDSMRPDAA